MRGSVNWQITEIFKSVNDLGTSKHEAKTEARFEGSKTWVEIGQAIGIHGKSTYEDYTSIAKNAFEYVRENYGCKDISRIETHMIQAYLVDKINNGGRDEKGVARATYNTYSSALHKFEVALNRYSAEKNLGRQFNFNLTEIGSYASQKLGVKNTASRAYRNVKVLADAVCGKYNLLAKVLQETGARISEVSDLKSTQLLGIRPDKQTGELKGWIVVVGKGGKNCEKGMSPVTYEKLEKAIIAGTAKTGQDGFRNALKNAAVTTNQKYEGPHGMRWSWAQARHLELQKTGLSYESTLSIISKEMSHNRSDITCHYLH